MLALKEEGNHGTTGGSYQICVGDGLHNSDTGQGNLKEL